jgi:CBS domain-containing protein
VKKKEKKNKKKGDLVMKKITVYDEHWNDVRVVVEYADHALTPEGVLDLMEKWVKEQRARTLTAKSNQPKRKRKQKYRVIEEKEIMKYRVFIVEAGSREEAIDMVESNDENQLPVFEESEVDQGYWEISYAGLEEEKLWD